MKLASRIRTLRKQKGLSVSDITNRTNLSPSFLYDIERGDTQPSIKSIDLIAMALGIRVEELLAGVEFASLSQNGNTIPPGLAELKAHPEYGEGLTEEWLGMLSGISVDGKAPQTMRDWLELYLHIKRVLG